MKIQKHLNLKYLTSGSSDLFLPPYLNNCVKTEDKKTKLKVNEKEDCKRSWFHLFLRTSGLSLQWLWWNLNKICVRTLVSEFLVVHVFSFTKVHQKGIIYKFPVFVFACFFLSPISHPPPSNLFIQPCQQVWQTVFLWFDLTDTCADLHFFLSKRNSHSLELYVRPSLWRWWNCACGGCDAGNHEEADFVRNI